MTTKELIRAEIERLKHYAEESKMEWVNEGYNQNAFAEDCRISSFDKLLSFLDTMPDEPITSCNELAEAAEKYADGPECSWVGTSALEQAFISGAEWMKTKMMEGAVEGEVQEVYRDEDGIHCSVSVGTDYKPGTIVYVITIPKEDEQ